MHAWLLVMNAHVVFDWFVGNQLVALFTSYIFQRQRATCRVYCTTDQVNL